MAKVFITGALGFIGRALTQRLQADGHDVTGVDLRADPERGVVAGDIAAAGGWQRHADGADVVVHTAAVVSLKLSGADDVWRANVLGTHNALTAAIDGGARRFVHVSSVTVFGFSFPDGVDERHPVRTTGVPYPDTKIASEQHVLAAHAEHRIEGVIVRPGDVYGPGSKPWAIQPTELIKKRQFALPDFGRGIFSPVYVDDLVDGMARAVTAPAAEGHVLTLSGGVGVPNRDFFGRYADALGMRLVLLPTPLAKAGAHVAQQLQRLQPGATGDLNPRAAEYMLRRGTYGIGRAREVLGWEPRVSVDDGLDRTVDWLRAAGHLER